MFKHTFHIVDLPLADRLRRWSNDKPTMIQRLVSAGIILTYPVPYSNNMWRDSKHDYVSESVREYKVSS